MAKDGSIHTDKIEEILNKEKTISGPVKKEADELLANIDKDGDGKVNQKEFKTLFSVIYDRQQTAKSAPQASPATPAPAAAPATTPAATPAQAVPAPAP